MGDNKEYQELLKEYPEIANIKQTDNGLHEGDPADQPPQVTGVIE